MVLSVGQASGEDALLGASAMRAVADMPSRTDECMDLLRVIRRTSVSSRGAYANGEAHRVSELWTLCRALVAARIYLECGMRAVVVSSSDGPCSDLTTREAGVRGLSHIGAWDMLTGAGKALRSSSFLEYNDRMGSLKGYCAHSRAMLVGAVAEPHCN
eukprot:363565-Chlamydomonas_euryale.AAC.9